MIVCRSRAGSVSRRNTPGSGPCAPLCSEGTREGTGGVACRAGQAGPVRGFLRTIARADMTDGAGRSSPSWARPRRASRRSRSGWRWPSAVRSSTPTRCSSTGAWTSGRPSSPWRSGAACRTTCWTSGTCGRPPTWRTTSAWPAPSSTDIAARGRVPILAGGSGLYIRAALDDLNFPGTDPARARAPGGGTGRAAAPPRCTPGWPGSTPPRPPRSCPATAAGSSARWRSSSCPARPFTATLPAVRVARTPRCRSACGSRARNWTGGSPSGSGRCGGRLRGRSPRPGAPGLRDGRTASRALGYAQMLRHLAGEWTLEQAREETVRATSRFARRQESWFRRDPRITWLSAPGDGGSSDAVPAATRHLTDAALKVIAG